MAWRDQLQQASFRDVEFFVDDHSLEFGRRVQLHDYPFKDDAYPEDLGGKDDVYSFPAFVVGEDYIAQRDKLIEALKKPGPGTLVHRYLGRIRVQGGVQRLRESSKEGGMARFSLVFYKVGAQAKPTSTIDTRQRVSIRADNALTVVQEQFEESYTTIGLPGWVTDAAEVVLEHLDTALAALDVVDSAINQYASLPSTIAGRVIDAISSLSTVSTVISAVSAVASLVNSFASGSSSSFSRYRSLFNYGDDLPTVPTTTPSRVQQSTNQQSIIDLVRRVSLIEASRHASTLTYDSHQEAIAVRNELAEALDEQMQTADDDTYLVLQDLRAAMVKDLTERAANLKQIRTYMPQATLPSLVIAHQLYQDATRADDIVARNKIGHPGFVTGGQTLEVLDA